jgi:hypothetical protein
MASERGLSGADIESIVLSARRRVLAAGRDVVAQEDLKAAIESFIPSAQGLEKEMQELAAVLECTDREFLPPDWQQRLTLPDGRSQLQKRFAAMRQMIEQ